MGFYQSANLEISQSLLGTTGDVRIYSAETQADHIERCEIQFTIETVDDAEHTRDWLRQVLIQVVEQL